MNDDPHSKQKLDRQQAERLEGDQNQAWKETAFRLAVARKFYALGKDTKQIAEEMKVDESRVYNVLDKIRRERINA